jgi:hypothetical protein
MAPSMSQNSLAKLLMTEEETKAGAKVHTEIADSEAQTERRGEQELKILEETIPYGYVTECLILLKQLELRL